MHAHVSVSRALARLLSAATTGVAALLTGGPAVAADAPAAATQPAAGAASLEEITVTANKLSAQAAIDVPGAIQAISGDALQREGAAQFIDIAPKIAGLQIQDLGPGDKKYIIRGINSTGDATTGVYFDEAVISGSNANDGGGRQADLGLFDLERVEVLRGPQGTLYGASSMSGTIRFITKKPQLFSFGG
ncbi:MAG: TonB-dependent receptor, partial [Gammaproteobacteria bacterium]